ncbi:MAG: polyprenyl synthetase family protein [Defluviitaleaceae bacterium]|nr:polyprenyl synthetase family protein [Defluviitaleaceae bacterium]
MLKTIQESGFCHGVKAAVHKADSLVQNLARGERVYLYGDLVNNRHVMARYKAAGFIVAENADGIDGGSVIIRAHGVGRAVYDELAKKDVKIVDCTCVKVKKIHEIVAGKKNVIIIGKKQHPEVLGILGWCENGEVAETQDELEAAMVGKTAVCVVGQTTCNKEWWGEAVEFIRKKIPSAQIFDTVCDVTARRIENAVKMAKETDITVVVGDTKSANSVELYNACRRVCGCVLFGSCLGALPLSSDCSVVGISPRSLDSVLADKEALPLSSDCSVVGISPRSLDSVLMGALPATIGIVGSASAPAEAIEEIGEFLLFANFLATAKQEIEAASEALFDTLIKNAENSPIMQAAIRDFYEQHKNGKRVRGALIKLGAEIGAEGAAGQVNGEALAKIALAYEIFQTAILIHDDIIDKSPTRRGKTTIHAHGDSHLGISRAICIGDYGLFLANKILAESGLDPKILAKVLDFFADIQLKTIEGEVIDVMLPHSQETAHEKYMRDVNKIYELKTAWYTIAGPLMLGAICGGADGEVLDGLRKFALPLGIAFQIKDDLLGIFGNEDVLGKPAISDILEKKQTILYGMAKRQEPRIDEHYGNPLADERSLEAVREIFTDTGAKKYAEDEIARLSQAALGAVAVKSRCELLRGLVHFLMLRRY